MTFVVGQVLTASDLNLVMPVGTIVPYTGAAAPVGWLLADGGAVSRTAYAALFAAIGTTYGAGDGSTTFNLPNVRGRVLVGKGAHSSVDTLGENDGLADASRNIFHTHSVTANRQADAATSSSPGSEFAGTTTTGAAGPPFLVVNMIVRV